MPLITLGLCWNLGTFLLSDKQMRQLGDNAHLNILLVRAAVPFLAFLVSCIQPVDLVDFAHYKIKDVISTPSRDPANGKMAPIAPPTKTIVSQRSAFLGATSSSS